MTRRGALRSHGPVRGHPAGGVRAGRRMAADGAGGAERLNIDSTPGPYGRLPLGTLPRVARSISIVAVAQVITWTATFLFTLAQARFLTPAHFGELSLAL